jgi:hypothetical protein
VVGGGGTYRFAVPSGDVSNRVGGGMDRGHHRGDVSESGRQVCRVADVAGLGAGWRPLLVAEGEPSNPQDEILELDGHQCGAGDLVDAGAGNVPVVSDRPKLGPCLAGCVGCAVQLRADRWAEGQLLGSFGQPAHDEFAGVDDDRRRQDILPP